VHISSRLMVNGTILAGEGFMSTGGRKCEMGLFGNVSVRSW
jgi:hypothetical protein